MLPTLCSRAQIESRGKGMAVSSLVRVAAQMTIARWYRSAVKKVRPMCQLLHGPSSLPITVPITPSEPFLLQPRPSSKLHGGVMCPGSVPRLVGLPTWAIRVGAATAIQRCFRAWLDRTEVLVYIHAKCASTAEADDLYRCVLRDSLRLVSVRLLWTEASSLRTGPASKIARMAREWSGSRPAFLVVGSHG
jgi:hypothetical protein